MTINEKLKKLRTEQGLSQKELAELLNITQASVSDYERGLRPLKMSIIQAYAEIFGVDMEYLNPISDGMDMHDILTVLFALDDRISLNIECRPSGKSYIMFQTGIMDEFLLEWKEMKSKLTHGLISKDQYDQWRAILLQEDSNNVN